MIAQGRPSPSVRSLLLCLTLLGLSAPAAAGTVRVAWDRNPEPDIAGYVLAWGVAAGTYTESVTVTAATATHEVASLAPGTYYFAVRAFNGAGMYSGYSNQVVAVVTSATPPAIASLSPVSGPLAGGTSVTIDGTGFQSGAAVHFGSQVATVLSQTATRLVARTPAQARGTTSVTVLNPDGTTAALSQAFTYRGPPTVSKITPSSGSSAGGTDVIIEGSDFDAGATVAVDGVAAPVQSAAASRLVVRMPAHAPTKVGLTITNPDLQLAWVPGAFTYVEGAPSIASIAPLSGSTAGGNTVVIAGSGFAGGASVLVDGQMAVITSQSDTALAVTMPAHAAGAVSVTVRNPDSLSATVVNGYTYDVRSGGDTFTRYFAEGASGSFFQTRFAVANPHDEPVPLTVTFTDTFGAPTPMTVHVPARTRMTIDERNRPVLRSEAFATKFEAPRVLGVERTVTWAAGGPTYGAHSETGVAAPRTSWVLAEGATIGGFNTFYLLQNPTTTAAEVKVQYLLATGQRIERVHAVGPLSRTNIWVNKDDPALASAEMSATLTSLNGVPVVVERSMYRNNGGELFSAGHNSAAVDAPALRWFLAEGATGGTFDEFVLIANPNPAAAALRVSYLRAGKTPIVKTYTAPAQSRLTIWVDQEAPELAAAEVSVVVESLTATPVVVERSMWWKSAPGSGEWVEAHNSRGVTATSARWLVADGEAGGSGQASTYVLVANTGSTPAAVRFTLLTEAGTTRTVQDTVTANGRYSMDVAGAFPEARGTRFSVLVEGVGPGAPLVVERASYSSTPSTPWASGTNSLAMPLP